MGGEVTAVGRNGRLAGATDQREGEGAQGGHDLGGRAGAQARGVLAEGDVAEAVVEAVAVADLHAPMAADEGEQAGGVGATRRQAGDEVDRLDARAALLAHGAHEAGDLGDARDRDGRLSWLLMVSVRRMQ